MKLCAIVPSHNHYKAVGSVVGRLREKGLPVFIIDDGSDEPALSALAAFHDGAKVVVRRMEENQGKGAVVMEGFRLAIAAGYTHALQVDADGQHDLSVLPEMIALAAASPEALISGQPIYDSSIPRSRKIGRWVTHVWVWIETLSFRIADSMCGLRIYPLAAVQKLMAEESIGHRMEFDTEIMVRLFWRGVAPVMLPVKVIYPPENISNFDVLQDNWRITLMHTRLVLTMLLHLPWIIANRPPQTNASHRWSTLGERGAYLGLKFCAIATKLLGPKACRIVLMPIVLYFYLTGTTQRWASDQFLTRVLKRKATFAERFRPFMNFAMRALDVIAASTGDLPSDIVTPTDPEAVAAIFNNPQGGLMVVSHLGNMDVMRALMDNKTRRRVIILVHTRHAENYNRMLLEFSSETSMNIMQVTEIGPETIIHLKQRVESGAWVVIAGDRTAVVGRNHVSFVPFFGAEAGFPHGPWVLGALLECPVYLLFCLRDGDRYRMTMELFAESLTLPRATRTESLSDYATRYAARLELFAASAPFQWYNFFDFWAR